MNNLKTKGLFIAVLTVLFWSCEKQSIEPVSQATVVENSPTSITDKATFLETQDAL
jgi:hypothetical protein